MSYLRITTHPRMFSAPLSPDEALGNVTALLSRRQTRAMSEFRKDFETYLVRRGHRHYPMEIVADR